jgi:hypothetical protein
MDARFCCGVNEINQTIRCLSLEGSFKNARRHKQNAVALARKAGDTAVAVGYSRDDADTT